MQINKQISAELKRLLPKAESLVIRGATHEMWAEQPDVCRARVAAFIAKHCITANHLTQSPTFVTSS
jgi:pimeloyl-ACP methyl ester carboxylesterase